MGKILDFSNYTFRCHSLGYLMTEPQEGDPYKKWQDSVNKIKEEKEKFEEKLLKYSDKLLTLKEGTKGRENEEFKIEKLKKEFSEKLYELKAKESEFASKKNDIVLSKTTISYLISVYIQEKYGRKKEIDNKYLQKGLGVEKKSESLIADVHDSFYDHNTERKFNDFVNGECDIFDSDNKRTLDGKANWNLHTFFSKKLEDLKPIYKWQGIGYMSLWKVKKHVVCNTLINTPEGIIEDEYRRALYSIGSNLKDTELYERMKENIRKNNIFDDIPEKERIYEVETEWDESEYERLCKRISQCREWLNEFAIKDFFSIYGREVLISEIGEERYSEIKYKFGFEKQLPKPASVPLVNEQNSEDVSLDEAQGNSKFEEKKLIDITPKEMEFVPVEIEVGVDYGNGKDVDLVSELVEKRFEDAEKTEFLPEVNVNIENPELNSTSDLMKAENITVTVDINSIKTNIENCQSEQDCIDYYLVIKKYFEDYPELKELLAAKREIFKNPVPKPKPSPKPPKEENQEPKNEVSKEDKLEKERELRFKTLECKTPEQVKELYINNKDFVNEKGNKDLKDFMNNILIERTNNPLIRNF